jgi:hypothetical protein
MVSIVLMAILNWTFGQEYFSFLRKPKDIDGPFVQLEAGSVVLFERGYSEKPEAFPAFSGGLSIGWRFNLGEKWYIEPAARGGYPHIWGGGITAGIRFEKRKAAVSEKSEQKEEIKEGDVIDDMKIMSDDEGNLRLQMFSIMFRNNQADFTGLSEEIIKNNFFWERTRPVTVTFFDVWHFKGYYPMSDTMCVNLVIFAKNHVKYLILIF